MILAITPTAIAQDLIEVSGGQRIVSPDFHCSGGSGCALTGTYYNPKTVRMGGELFMYVQGGQFNSNTSPVPWCDGDMIILYTAPYTTEGVTSSFSAHSRISPCDPADTRYFTTGSLFFDAASQSHRMVVTASRPDLSGALRFKELLLWETTDGVTGSWTPFLEIDIPNDDVGIETTLLAPDVTRTAKFDKYEHSFFRGYARLGFGNTIELRLDISDAHCGQALPGGECQLVEFKKRGVWTPATGGRLDFRPDVLLGNFKPWGLSAVNEQLQLWGSPSTTPGTQCDVCSTPLGSTFEYYKVAGNWSLDGPYTVLSELRCMPSDIDVGRAYPWLLQFGSRLLLYSATNDDNMSDTNGDGMCDSPPNPFVGMYIVLTELEPYLSPPDPPGAVPNFTGTVNGQDIDGLTVNTTSPRIDFTWDHADSPIGIDRYQIVLSLATGEWIESPHVLYPATSYTLQTSGLEDGTSYLTHIRAQDVEGTWGPWVQGGTFVVELSGLPSSVPNFTGTINGQDIDGLTVNTTSPRIDFTWDHADSPIGIDRYQIVLSLATGEWIESPHVLYPATSYTLQTSGLEDGTSYLTHIRAQDVEGTWGPWIQGGTFAVDLSG